MSYKEVLMLINIKIYHIDFLYGSMT